MIEPDNLAWSCQFTSDRFLPKLPAQCQVNPGAYGFELAWWPARQLHAKGLVTSYPVNEDWGWLLDFTGVDDIDFVIGCHAESTEGDECGYAGLPIGWNIFVNPHLGLVRRLKGKRDVAVNESNRIGTIIEKILLEAGLSLSSVEIAD